MSEHQADSLIVSDGEAEGQEAAQESQPVRPTNWLRRLGCGLLVVIWFTILLLPCFFIALATQQEIRLSQGSLPGQEIRIWLIMDETQRGIGVSSTSAESKDGLECLQTYVNYLLWQGEGNATRYCDCYERRDDQWGLVETYTGSCSGNP